MKLLLHGPPTGVSKSWVLQLMLIGKVIHLSFKDEAYRVGRIQLLMFNVSHFLAEQQTITVSETSNFLIY